MDILKHTVSKLPTITINSIEKDVKEYGDYYGWDINFLGNNQPNILKINDLQIYRKYKTLSEIKVPYFFNKIEYAVAMNLPQIFPILVGINDTTDEIVYTVEIPPFRRIDKKTSG